MADDNDRWLHQIPGSRRLALAVVRCATTRPILPCCTSMSTSPSRRHAGGGRRAEAGIHRSFQSPNAAVSLAQLGDTGVIWSRPWSMATPVRLADAWAKRRRTPSLPSSMPVASASACDGPRTARRPTFRTLRRVSVVVCHPAAVRLRAPEPSESRSRQRCKRRGAGRSRARSLPRQPDLISWSAPMHRPPTGFNR